MLILHVSPEKGAQELSRSAAMTVTDRGYLKIERAWRDTMAQRAACPVIQVETNVVVPVETASGKEEYAARTLRPKVRKLMDDFAQPLEETEVHCSSLGLSLPFEVFDVENTDAALNRLNLDRRVLPARSAGGSARANQLLRDFVQSKLADYPAQKNDPGMEASSGLSPYLHFGQISPLTIYQSLKKAPADARDAFLEELVVRRELSMNFVFYNGGHDSYECLPAWAKATLDRHRRDRRPYTYSPEELEEGDTHDPYWNAAQKELSLTGTMNGYMRMYWGKKILEWGRTPEEAYQSALHLNNRFSVDGRDANAFAGVAWCFGKHDRPWQERPVFGTVRYMNAAGLDRKFNMQQYLDKIGRLSETVRAR